MATVAPTPRTITITLASASAGPFLLGFRLFDSDTLDVYINGVAASVTWSLTASYLNGYTDDASISFISDLPIGAVITIDGAQRAARDADYLNSDPGLTRKLNIELARLWAGLNEVKRDTRRSLRSFDYLPPFDGLAASDIAEANENAIAAAGYAAAAGKPYATRAELIAATVLAPVLRVSVLGVGDYERDDTATNPAATSNGGAYKWVPARNQDFTPRHFGALGNDVADDADAFDAAVAAMVPWGNLVIPEGSYRLSRTWVVKNRYRCSIDFRGVIKPYGSFSDYLVWFSNDTGDALVPSMGQSVVIQGVTVDCEWKSRGIKFEKQYDASFDHIRVWRPYGTGISCPMVQEVSFWQPIIHSGKARVNATILAAASWSAAVTYAADAYVRRAYAAYNAGTAYVAGDLAESGGFLHRALLASTGATPTSSANADKWERIPFEYFQATSLASNLNKDPHGATDYTTRSATSDNRFWKPVWPDEAAWEFVGNGATVTIDNPKIFGFITRANEHNTIIRVDGAENSFNPAKIEFYGPQFHALTSAYISAFNANSGYVAAFGRTIAAPTNGTLVHLISATGFKIIGGQMQVGDLPWAKGLLCGTLGVSGAAAKTFLSAMQIEGTAGGDAQVGISILPSIETFGGNWVQSGLNIVMPGVNSVAKVDPKGKTEFFQSGTSSLARGSTSMAIVFASPFAATPVLAISPRGNLGGLSYAVSGLTNTGFTLTVSGNYTSPIQTAAFTAAGGTNQLSTYTHNFGLAADSYALLGATGDFGANYRVILNTSTINVLEIKAPAAPSADTSQKWVGVWEAKAPAAIQFGWFARVEMDE